MVGNILSICIPVYNRERELRECLESIEQNYVDGVEVIICDNHSTDRTTEVIRASRTDYYCLGNSKRKCWF